MDEILTQNPINTFSTINVEELLMKLSDTVLTFGGKILLAIGVYLIGRWIVKRINKIVGKLMKKRNIEPSLFSFVKSLVSISLNLVLIIVIIGILGIETSSFIALFASAGIAIGMALSGTLQNFAGGVMILLFKPYKVGDFIEAQGKMGTVKEIQIFNTILTTSDNKIIFVPNGSLSTGIMTNFSKSGTRRVEWSLTISGENYDKTKEIIISLFKEDDRIKTEPPCFIAINSISGSSVNIIVYAYVNENDFSDVFHNINELFYKTFDKEGISCK